MFKEIQKWKDLSVFRKEMSLMKEEELADAFAGYLSFGTGGLRGIIGAGTNRMNIYTIRRASYGFGAYLRELHGAGEIKVAIAYDNRHFSQEFAMEAAMTLSHFGIIVYIFYELRPTPLLSFAVRHLSCQGGIVVTASHNPKEYNGYKVYDSTGCQLGLDASAKLINIINNIKDVFALDINADQSKIVVIEKEIDEAYLHAVKDLRYRALTNQSDLKIAYTPLHGTAIKLIEPALKTRGYDLLVVTDQAVSDPNFSATKSANPEEKAAYEKVLELAKKHNADLVMATDPDGDRIGIAVQSNKDYIFLSGNQTGALLIDYILNSLKDSNKLPRNGVIYNTIVTSRLGEKIAKSHNVNVHSTLTGFKFIGEQIRLEENKKDGLSFIFGYEESYGYLLSPLARDKDSIQAAIIISEMVLYYKQKKLTLVDRLNQLYHQYGAFYEDQLSLTLKGQNGLMEIQKIMNFFRSNQVQTINNVKVKIFEDYLLSKRIENNKENALTLPPSDVIKLIMEDDSFIAIRPSGTEPKLKVYFAICGKENEIHKKAQEYRLAVEELLKKI